jgi:hypothetical protein
MEPRNQFRGIDSASLCSLVVRSQSTTNRVVVPARQAGIRFLGSLTGGLQIRAQYTEDFPDYRDFLKYYPIPQMIRGHIIYDD